LLISGQAIRQATYLWGIRKILRILLGLRASWQGGKTVVGSEAKRRRLNRKLLRSNLATISIDNHC
jgi:hypothetical protein